MYKPMPAPRVRAILCQLMFDAEELVEDACPKSARDSRSRVRHGDQDGPVGVIRAGSARADGDVLAAGRVLERVRHDVVEDDLQTALVTGHRWETDLQIRVQGHRLCVRLSLGPAYDIRQQHGHGHGFEVQPQLPGFDTGQVEKLMDRVGQLLDADQGRRHQLALTRRQQIGGVWL
jgi:hypothetical protein